MLRAVCTRGAWLLGAWVVLIGASPFDLACGIPTAALATVLSLALLPPGRGRPSAAALVRLGLCFVAQSGSAS